jgi:hypothetical protein
MTGTTVSVQVDGIAYVMDPLVNRKETIPVQLAASYRPDFIRSEAGELLKIAFWKEASTP